MKTTLRQQTLDKCRHLLSEINRDPSSNLRGCFDRRFWAWKLVDFPDATFQRNLAPLAWYDKQKEIEAQLDSAEATPRACEQWKTTTSRSPGSFRDLPSP